MKKNMLFTVLFFLLIQILCAVQMQQTRTIPEKGMEILTSEQTQVHQQIPEYTVTSRDNRLGMLWQTSDPSAIASCVEVSDVTQNSFVAWHLNDERVSLYHDSATPLWEYIVGDLDFGFPVDMTEDGSVIAVADGNVIRIFEPSSATPVWENALDFSIGEMVLNTDGTQVFVASYDSGLDRSSVSCYDIGNTNPIWSSNFIGGTQSLVINEDSTVLIFTQYAGTNSALWVLDSSDGAIIFEGPQYNQNPPAICQDGSIFVNGDYAGYVQVYQYNEDIQTYEEIWNFHVGGGGTSAWIGGMSISADGSTIAVGTLVFLAGDYDGEIYLFNSYSPTPIWVYENVGDYAINIDMTNDGSLIAVACYGPLDGSTPDFFLFRRNSNIPVFDINTSGSLFAVDISPDGSFCTTGGKAVHARILGSGGLVYSVDCDLGGGFITGTVNLDGSDDNSGVKVEIPDLIDYFDYTDFDGNYSLDNVPAGVYTIEYSKIGYVPAGNYDVVVNEGQITVLGEILMFPFGSAPENLIASQSAGITVNLNWIAPSGNPQGYNIYRKSLEQDPYPEDPYATVPADQNWFEDDGALPLVGYYYVVTTSLAGGFQSPYSNEAIGWSSTGFVVDEISVYYGTTPVIDGSISPGEWNDAYMVDCSDFWGTYDNTIQPIGSVIGYFKMNADQTELYVAYENFNDTVLEDHDEVAFYIDDNNDGTYPPSGDDSEGNYWAAYYAAGNQLKYRPIYSSGGVGTVVYLTDPQLEVSVATGHLVYEFMVPFGIETWQINPSAENQSSLAIFVLDDNAPDPHGFDAWWPLDNMNLFSPIGYGTITYGEEAQVPPPPENVVLTNIENDITLTWDMPDINDFSYFNIFYSYEGGDFEVLDTTVGTVYEYLITQMGYYQFYITTVNQMGMESDPSAIVEYTTAGNEGNVTPLKTALYGNYPNPFNPETAITFNLTAEDAKGAEIEIFNIKGQKIKTFPINTFSLTPINSIIWDGKDERGKAVSSGIYLYRLETEKISSTKKMLLMK